jgi:CheY-like chemotaxis protein
MPGALADQRVLVVDDDVDWSEALCTTLRTLGAEVHAAGTADDAMALLTIAKMLPMTAMVIDVGLPHQDGYSLLAQIRGLGGAAEATPAIAVTAYTSLEHRRRAFEADFAAFCSKPVSPEDIALAILDVTKDDCGTRSTQPPGHV